MNCNWIRITTVASSNIYSTFTARLPHFFERLFLLCVGVVIAAFGVAFAIKAAIGTSPISSLPYVTSEMSGLTVGETTIIMNLMFVLIQIALLRKNYSWWQLLQFPVVCLFGVMIDVAELSIENLTCSAYWEQWLFCFIGILALAVGISMQVCAKLVPTPGEGLVLAICQVGHWRFGNIKVIFDVTLVAIATILSLSFLGGLDGVREGTVVAALLVGQITKKTNPMIMSVGRHWARWKSVRFGKAHL